MRVLMFILFVSGLLVSGCHRKKSIGNDFYISIPNHSCVRLGDIKKLVLDTLFFDGSRSSMEGQFFIKGDSIFMADEVVGAILAFDKKGYYINQVVKRGNGPNEILGITAIASRDGGCISIDGQWGVSVYDQNWHRIYNFRIDWMPKHSLKEQQKNPDPEDSGIYEMEFYKRLIRPYGKKKMMLYITSEHPDFNAFSKNAAEKFYRESYTMALISLETGRVEKMLCPYSPVYSQYHSLSTFKNQLFDTYGEHLFYSFEADSLIYYFNPADSSVVSFGHAGKEMNTTYPVYENVDDSDANYAEDHEKYGYYRYLKYDDHSKLLFRGYRKGAKPLADGLQIYRDRCLIADMEVPRNFELVGYIAPYFYAYGGSDYDQEVMIFYRFRL